MSNARKMPTARSFIEEMEKDWRKKMNRLQSQLDKGLSLSKKLELLFIQQNQAGFVQGDIIKKAQRFWVPRLSGGERRFLIQYNSERADRSKGFGRKNVPIGSKSVNGGCFLCLENIFWQQKGLEIGYRIDINGREYIALCNPFPLMECHMTITSGKHEPQQWMDEKGSGKKIERVVSDLLELASRSPGFIFFYNGPKAGATIEEHLHFHAFKRPIGQDPYPMEEEANRQLHERQAPPFHLSEYPITTIFFRGKKEEIAEGVSNCIQQWTESCENWQNLSANIICSYREDKNGEAIMDLYLVPRDILFSKAPGRTGIVGGLEVLGEIVFSSPEEGQLINSGKIDYNYIWSILKSVEAHTVQQFLEATRNTINI